MRRKIEITPDGQSYTERTSPADVPGLGDKVTPNSEANTETVDAPEQENESSTVESGGGTTSDGASAYITALQAEMEDLRAKAEDAEKRLMYAQAEFQNVTRRKEEQYRADQKYVNSELIKSLLPVVDSFERALKAAEQTKNFEALVGGVSGTLKQLTTFLEKAGATPITAVGQEFDPQFHEAIGHTDSSEYPANTVAEEVQRGYLMHDRVLRPSLVKVSA